MVRSPDSSRLGAREARRVDVASPRLPAVRRARTGSSVSRRLHCRTTERLHLEPRRPCALEFPLRRDAPSRKGPPFHVKHRWRRRLPSRGSAGLTYRGLGSGPARAAPGAGSLHRASRQALADDVASATRRHLCLPGTPPGSLPRQRRSSAQMHTPVGWLGRPHRAGGERVEDSAHTRGPQEHRSARLCGGPGRSATDTARAVESSDGARRPARRPVHPRYPGLLASRRKVRPQPQPAQVLPGVRSQDVARQARAYVPTFHVKQRGATVPRGLAACRRSTWNSSVRRST